MRTEDGRQFLADKVIIATGSWTPTIPALQGLAPEGLMTATGQVIAAIQLDEEMRRKYENIPVVMRFDEGQAGFYSFPVRPGSSFCLRSPLTPHLLARSLPSKGCSNLPSMALVSFLRRVYPEQGSVPKR